MTYYIGSIPASDSLMHYGIKGMRWGRRRFENPDGSLTAAGKLRYRKRGLRKVDPSLAKNKASKRVAEDYHSLSRSGFKSKYHTSKGAFKRRYKKSDGDTYGMGKRRAAKAMKVSNAVKGATGVDLQSVGRRNANALVKVVKRANRPYIEDGKLTPLGIVRYGSKEGMRDRTKRGSLKQRHQAALKAQGYKRYGKGNIPGQGVYEHYKNQAEYYKKVRKKNKKLRGKARIKANYNAYLDAPMRISGITGTANTTLRKRLRGQSYELF